MNWYCSEQKVRTRLTGWIKKTKVLVSIQYTTGPRPSADKAHIACHIWEFLANFEHFFSVKAQFDKQSNQGWDLLTWWLYLVLDVAVFFIFLGRRVCQLHPLEGLGEEPAVSVRSLVERLLCEDEAARHKLSLTAAL